MFQFEADVEVVFNGTFAPARDDNDVLNAGMHGLFDAILDKRFVDDREHLFRLRLRGRQEAGSQTGGGKYGFTHLWDHQSPLYAFDPKNRPIAAVTFVRQRRCATSKS